MPDLILIPTETERKPIEGQIRLDPERWAIETIGFGVIASGIKTSKAIARHQPSRIVLAGIAGLFANHQSEVNRVGGATWFDSVAVDGIGIGQGDDYVDAFDLGWKWFESDEVSVKMRCEKPPEVTGAMLLTVCSGSANETDAGCRARRFPDAVGEDMESFSVALSCVGSDARLYIVRGFSNIVGCRDKTQWHIGEALSSVAEQMQQLIDGYAQ